MSNTEKETYINEAENAILHTYNRFQVVFDHGKALEYRHLDMGMRLIILR